MQRRLYPVALLSAYALAVALRAPWLLRSPRFWGEEGGVYYAAAIKRGFFDALFAVHQGYFSLLNNVAGMLAALAPVEHAPAVTVVLAFMVQLLPPVLILINDMGALEGRYIKAGAVLVVLLTVPTHEVWLNSTNAQVFLCLSVVIVLFSKTTTGPARWANLGVLLLSGLSGLASVLLAPFFWVKAYLERSRERALQAALLTAPLVMQVAIMAFSLKSEARIIRFDIVYFLYTAFIKFVVLPFLGTGVAEAFSQSLRASLGYGQTSALVIAGAVGAFVLLGAIFYKSGAPEPRMLIVVALYLSFISFVGSLDAEKYHIIHISAFGNERYYYVPNVLIGLSLLYSLSKKSRLPGALKALCTALVVWILLAGAVDFVKTDTNYLYKWYFRGPDWKSEVHKWRANPSHPIAIWPEGWNVRI